jgi:type VI secretion system protein ImpA
MAAPTANPGQINSRRDVEKVLDLVIDFYERTEPSSPIPHLARRMRKMVPMNFLQLMEEIAPSGLKEFKNTAGVFDDKNKPGRE